MANEPTDPRNSQYPASNGGELPPGYYVADDEISLFDLWLVLVRRRWLMVAVFIVVVASGLAYALTRPTVYEYAATLAIGEVFKSGGEDQGMVLAPVQSPEGVVAEIRSVREPSAVREIVGNRQDSEYVPEVDVTSPEGSNLVILSGETTTDNAGRLKRTMELIAERVQDSHTSRIEAARNRIQREIESAKKELERFKARQKSQKKQLSSLDAKVKTLKERRDDLETELGDLLEQRRNASDDVSSRYLMTLNSQIASVRDEIQGVEEQLTDQIPTKRRETRLALREMRAEVEENKEAKADAESRLSDITNTRLSSAPNRALEPTGTSGKLILALAIVLGGMLAIFGAFVWEFVTRANAYAKEQEGRV